MGVAYLRPPLRTTTRPCSPVAQLRFESDAKLWALYWPDRNERWRRYDGLEPASVGRVLEEIDDDPTCIFWG
jgi:hypothetical protein